MSTCRRISIRPVFAVATLLCVLTLSGCSALDSSSPRPDVPADAALASDLPRPLHTTDDDAGLDYDPWESFNQRTFYFNFNVLDRYGMKPAAEVWSRALPQMVRTSLGNAFDNVAMPRRFLNKVLQGRLEGAGEELARFALNSTVGVAGFLDVASRIGLESSDADTGQTLGVYGIRPGPYLVLPVLQPLTVRDAIGYAADSFMDPLSLFVTPLIADFSKSAAYAINERAAHMTDYDDVEDTSLDLYAAVRNGYLQRRQKSIEEAIRDRDRSWPFTSQRFVETGAPLDSAQRTPDVKPFATTTE